MALKSAGFALLIEAGGFTEQTHKAKFVTEPELNLKYQYDDSLPRLAHNKPNLQTTTAR